ncbi:MAG: hypothetical protein EPO42_01350 [Gallionellaceae bacterium]|nr:MAG: hypothetical protein EPO42_01350 [Gallionellaceae bacterium]
MVMLGSSSGAFNACVQQTVRLVQPNSIMELGCGQGKFGELLRQTGSAANLTGVQKIFSGNDIALLEGKGYRQIIDRDILDFYREGFDENYDLIVALDVIEHFLLSDVMSIIHFSLYRANYLLLVWPSAHPQSASNNAFDRHRASFDLKEVSDRFDVVFYSQTGFAQMHYMHRYHIVLIRGFMNPNVLPPFIA